LLPTPPALWGAVGLAPSCQNRKVDNAVILSYYTNIKRALRGTWTPTEGDRGEVNSLRGSTPRPA